MINTKIYSQRDIRWTWRKVGFGKGRFGTIGCTVTALTGLLFVAGYDLTPPQVAEKLRAVNGFATINGKGTDLIIWAKIEKAFPRVKFIWRSYKYDNNKVKEILAKGTPVLVEVLMYGQRHWVLFLGNKMMSDPWIGKVVPTSKYQPIGYSEIEIKK
jgi:hypothetical protein